MERVRLDAITKTAVGVYGRSLPEGFVEFYASLTQSDPITAVGKFVKTDNWGGIGLASIVLKGYGKILVTKLFPEEPRGHIPENIIAAFDLNEEFDAPMAKAMVLMARAKYNIGQGIDKDNIIVMDDLVRVTKLIESSGTVSDLKLGAMKLYAQL